jgi:hypothetical protein
MANIMDYLDWRGDLTFFRSPFNEVDSMILCMLCCVDFTGYVPAPGENRGEVLKEVAARYFEVHDVSETLGVLTPAEVLPMFHKMAGTARFGGLLLSAAVNTVDEEREEQFSALCVTLPDGTKNVIFRGTDDTIVAWKENFNMSVFDTVPAQSDALSYLLAVARGGQAPLRVCGHSKGGNLAVFAAMHCPPDIQARILNIYNSDGPGFRQPVLDDPGYQNIRQKITTLVPQSSTVGMLLSHSEEYEVVRSTKLSGPFQHNGFTWEVLGTSFIRRPDLSFRGRLFDQTFKVWLEGLSLEQRRECVDALFDILTSTGARTLRDLNENRLRKALDLARNSRRLEPEGQHILSEALSLLLRQYLRNMTASLPKPTYVLRGVLETVRLPGLKKDDAPAEKRQISNAATQKRKKPKKENK